MNTKTPLILALILLLCSCMDQKAKDQVIVFCASSLTPVVEQLKQQWEKEHSAMVITSSASSGTLARQIENGAEADIFLSASEEWMAHLLEKMQLDIRADMIAANRLAMVVPSDSKIQCRGIDEFFELISGNKYLIAIGDPAHVPLGKYAKEVIENHIPFQQIIPRPVLTKDARSALRLVELGEVDIGIAYQSDARASSARTIFSIPEKYHTQITYQGVLLNKHNTSAMKFYRYLSSVDNRQVWKNHGFSL